MIFIISFSLRSLGEVFQVSCTKLLGKGGKTTGEGWKNYGGRVEKLLNLPEFFIIFLRKPHASLHVKKKGKKKKKSCLRPISSVRLRAPCSDCFSAAACFQLVTNVWRIWKGWFVFYQKLSISTDSGVQGCFPCLNWHHVSLTGGNEVTAAQSWCRPGLW